MKRARKSPSPSSGQVRIIAGQWRGRKLPVADSPGLRPSTDRTRETLFNWLMHETTDAVCLDAFAGSGALGLEALSRYAKSVLFIEQQASLAKQLSQNIATLNADAEVKVGDALATLAQLEQPFDIVFLDPPFHQGLVQPMIDALLKHDLLAPNATVYIECERECALSIPSELSLRKQKQTQQVSYGVYDYLGTPPH